LARKAPDFGEPLSRQHFPVSQKTCLDFLFGVWYYSLTNEGKYAAMKEYVVQVYNGTYWCDCEDGYDIVSAEYLQDARLACEEFQLENPHEQYRVVERETFIQERVV
jgi:hypothetical protein